MARTRDDKFEIALCEAFGLKPNDVYRLVVLMEARKLPRAKAYLYSVNDAGEKFYDSYHSGAAKETRNVELSDEYQGPSGTLQPDSWWSKYGVQISIQVHPSALYSLVRKVCQRVLLSRHRG